MRESDIHDYRGEYDKAIVSNDNALQMDPDCADAWFNKTITLNKQGRHSESTRCVTIALNLYKLRYCHLQVNFYLVEQARFKLENYMNYIVG